MHPFTKQTGILVENDQLLTKLPFHSCPRISFVRRDKLGKKQNLNDERDENFNVTETSQNIEMEKLCGMVCTLYKTRSSDKSSYPTYDIHFLKQNDLYFHVGYAI